MEWIKRGTENTISEIVSKNTGMTVPDLLNDTKTYSYPGIKEAATLFLNHVNKGSIIRVYADYDTDGVTSASSIKYLFTQMHLNNAKVLTPRRFTDGYGININRVDECIEAGCNLLITVDNGIAAIDAIQKARDAGIDVIILDHHEAFVNENQEIILPNANIIVDPHITGGDFNDLCGAGIALKFGDEVLAQMGDSITLEQKQLIHSRMCSFAAVGTIGDIVSLTADNRKIVKEGINYMQMGMCTKGLKELLNTFGQTKVTSLGIGFGTSAGINAAGRLLDNGAALMTALLSFDSLSDELTNLCNEAKNRNEERKAQTIKAIENAKTYYDMTGTIDNFIVYFDENLSVGIAGLVASRLVEEFNRPAIVLCTAPGSDTIIKGSGRSIEGVDLKELLDQVNDKLLGYGGHPMAAGVTLERKKLNEFREAINAITPVAKPLESIYYDMEVDPSSTGNWYGPMMNFIKESDQFEPYGAGNPKIVVKISNVKIGDKWGNTYKLMGADHQHVKLCADGMSIVWFNHADDYKNMGYPTMVDIIGTISANEYNGKITPQFMPIDLRPSTN